MNLKAETHYDLEDLRAEIDLLDHDIIEKIYQREQVVLKVMEYKKRHELPVFDAKREEFLDKYHAELSEKYNVSIEFIKNLFKLIMDESKRIQSMKIKT